MTRVTLEKFFYCKKTDQLFLKPNRFCSIDGHRRASVFLVKNLQRRLLAVANFAMPTSSARRRSAAFFAGPTSEKRRLSCEWLIRV